ncbi:hypothetical protein IV203_035672 [Nitzschia inconspicua]|uniref:Uncharacterized protein n=1 Tax=Nitzschia inconspicua TaxID=303405 RepID=A0A9K3LFH6_9STRA|nr:hypothetical protein IV203_035672 [Nitzschia inconspicua]
MTHPCAEDLRVESDIDDEFEDASALDGLRTMVSDLQAALGAASITASITASTPASAPALSEKRKLAHMNHMYADDCRRPQALSSCVDVASDSGYVRISPISSANRRSLPDNRATLTDITTVESSAPPDSPAPAPTLPSDGAPLRVSTASTYGDDVHASIGCDVPFALSAIPHTGDGDLRAALEAVSLFASNILASPTSGDLRAALASVSSFTSTVLAHHLQPSADPSVESGTVPSAPHPASQPSTFTATDATSLVDTAAAAPAASVLCLHDPPPSDSSCCTSSDFSVSAYQPFELPSEFGQSALAHCPVHTRPILLCSSAVFSDLSCPTTMKLCPSLAFLPWPPFAPPWDHSFVFPLAPAPPWCFSYWFSPGPWTPLDTILPSIGLLSALILLLFDCLMCCHPCPSVRTSGSAYTLHDRSLLPLCLHFVSSKSIPCGGACSLAPVLCLQHVLPAPVCYGARSLPPIPCFLLTFHGQAHPDILQPATLVSLAILWQSLPSRVSVPSALQHTLVHVVILWPILLSRVSAFASLQPLPSAKLVDDLPPSWPHQRPCPTFDLDSMLRVATALLSLVFSHWKWLPASSSLHPAPASSFYPCLPSLIAALWSQREHLLVAPPWPSPAGLLLQRKLVPFASSLFPTAGLVLQREHVTTVAPPWLSPLSFIPPKEHSSFFRPCLPLTQLLFQREHSLLPPLLLSLGPVSAPWQELSFVFVLPPARECLRPTSPSAFPLQELPFFWSFLLSAPCLFLGLFQLIFLFSIDAAQALSQLSWNFDDDDPLLSWIAHLTPLATAAYDQLCPHDVSVSLVYLPLAIVASLCAYALLVCPPLFSCFCFTASLLQQDFYLSRYSSTLFHYLSFSASMPSLW